MSLGSDHRTEYDEILDLRSHLRDTLAQLAAARRELAAERALVARLIEVWPGDDDLMVSDWGGFFCVGSDHATQYPSKRAAVLALAGEDDQPGQPEGVAERPMQRAHHAGRKDRR